MKILFYDLETTGYYYYKNSIHQLSAELEVDGVVVDSINIRMQPHPKAQVDPQALKKSHTTEEELYTFQTQQEGLKRFVQWLEQYVDRFDKKDKIFMCGFNNRRFDDPFMAKWFDLCGNSWLYSYFWSDSFDVLVMASLHFKDRRAELPSFQLKRIAMELGLTVDKEKLHDALDLESLI